MPAGTSSIAPLDFTAGTNLTSAEAGAMEYDGKVPYFTPQGTQRGIIPGMQYYRLNSGIGGANATGAQSTFGVGVTLSSSTVYAFELFVYMSHTVGAVSHTISHGFGGTATLNNIQWNAYANWAAGASSISGLTSATQSINAFAAAAVVSSAALANAATWWYGRIVGTVSINAGGTFIPQYSLSAAPGGAYTTQTGSYMMIYPISASGAATNVGTWA